MNIQQNINKVLIAIRMSGTDIKIDRLEYYSDKIQNYYKIYVVYIKKWVKNRHGEEVNKYVRQDEFVNKVLLLKWLVNKYKEGEENGR